VGVGADVLVGEGEPAGVTVAVPGPAVGVSVGVTVGGAAVRGFDWSMSPIGLPAQAANSSKSNSESSAAPAFFTSSQPLPTR
jgi:hypothetical protein